MPLTQEEREQVMERLSFLMDLMTPAERDEVNGITAGAPSDGGVDRITALFKVAGSRIKTE